MGDEEIEAVTRVIRSGWLSTGKETALFEQELSEYLNIPYVVCVSSASMGLEIALLAHGVRRGNRVITTPMTFVATPNAIVHTGGVPVFADIDGNGLLSPYETEKKMDRVVSAILPVDLYGQSVNVAYFESLAEDFRIPFILDAAQSFGRPGTFPTTSVFSFYVTKNLAAGEGGAVATYDRAIAERVRLLSNQGQSVTTHERYQGSTKTYDVTEMGFKGNMSDILAAIGRVQLKKIDSIIEKRKQLFATYDSVVKSHTPENKLTNYHLFTIQSPHRDGIRKSLEEHGVGTTIHYPSIQSFSAYRWDNETPVAKKWGEETLTLPTNSNMTADELGTVINALYGAGC